MSDNYFSALPRVDKSLVIAMNEICSYSRACNFKFNDKDCSIRFKYNEILSGSSFIKANFIVNDSLCRILISKDNFCKIISINNKDLDAKILPKSLLFQLGECLTDLMIIKLGGDLGLDINFLSFEEIKINNFSAFHIGVVLHFYDFCSVNMIIDAESDVINVLCESIKKFAVNMEIYLPNVPIVAKLVLGSTVLRAEHIMSGSSEAIKEGDVLVVHNNSVDNLFVSVFDRFFYPAYLTDQSIVTTKKLVDVAVDNRDNYANLDDDLQFSREEDFLEDSDTEE